MQREYYEDGQEPTIDGGDTIDAKALAIGIMHSDEPGVDCRVSLVMHAHVGVTGCMDIVCTYTPAEARALAADILNVADLVEDGVDAPR